MKPLYSPAFVLDGALEKKMEITDLSVFARLDIPAKTTGDGKGYHGLRTYNGAPLIEIMRNAGIKPDISSAILISSSDGYRSLISYGELFFAPYGRNIIIADTVAGQPLEANGKFIALFPDDLSADRWVKAVSRIEVISLKQKPILYIIGMGCGDSNLISIEAISALGKADVFISAEELAKRFSKYMGDKPILFDPLMNAEPFFRKQNPGLSETDLKQKLEEQRARDLQMIRDSLKAGKTVGFLEFGDPTIYGSWIHWLQEFEDRIEIIPGLSAFNVSNAMIRKHYGCNGSIVLTVPNGLTRNESLLKSVADNGDTLAIFIGLKEMKNLLPLFKKYYQVTTPVAVVYKAGYSDGKRVVRTTMADVMNITEREEEKHLGMIYIGPCLK
jgi:precorrin-4 methylase